jgi:3-(3-hydroxy-phenyl)propionate hydroxylase
MGVEEHAVVVAGSGPVGMMLAGELALAGVDVMVVERRPDQGLAGSRAGGFQSRTVEVFDQRGIADRFLAGAQLHRSVMFGGSVLDASDLPTRHPYMVAIWQNRIERILADWLADLGLHIRYACEVSGFEQHERSVDVRVADGKSLRAQYLVGCDGGRSLIRREAGIAFPGWDATRSSLIAEAGMSTGPDEDVLRHDAAGVHAVHRMEDGKTFRVVVTEREIGSSSHATLSELSAALTAVFGTDYGIHTPTWISRFTDMTRQAAAYRHRRVLLAGDAAHIHYPAGGQGLSLGVQDAVNLGWKLAQVVKGISPDSLLDTYHAERHPVGARILKHTVAQAALQRRDDRTQALVDFISELTRMNEPRRHIAALMTGLDIHYELGEGHPLLGRRMPDLDLTTTEGAVRVYELLHDARPLLLNLGPPRSVEVAGWADRVRLTEASHEGKWELPVIGVVSAPTAVLVRPDGYVGWVGNGTQDGLAEALTAWFGAPTAT